MNQSEMPLAARLAGEKLIGFATVPAEAEKASRSSSAKLGEECGKAPVEIKPRPNT
jgi:hypothetical protein